MKNAFEVAEGIYLIDAQTWVPGYSSVYLVVGDKIALVETGLSTSADVILDGIKELGFNPGDIAYILVTHIHLDHAGAAGILAKRIPTAQVVVHQVGAPHLIDPSRLLQSSRKALGEFGNTYGLDQIVGIEEQQVMSVDDGDLISLGWRELRIIYSPGHASHHICIYDQRSKALFCGDTVGMYFPDGAVLAPTTPPPDFNLDTCIRTINSLRAYDIEVLLFSHFGPAREVSRIFDLAIDKLNAWAMLIRDAIAAKHSFQDIAQELCRELKRELYMTPEWLNEQLAPVFVAGYLNYFQIKM